MNTRLILSIILMLLALPKPAVAANPPVPADHPHADAIGRYTQYFKERNGPLTLQQAISAYDRDEFSPAKRPVLAFGIGSQPVWIHFAVANDTKTALPQRLSIETAWLDQLDVYIRHGGNTVAAYHVGDRKPFSQRPVDSRYYVFDHAFAPGISDVFLRVQTADPMVVPIFLMSPARAQTHEEEQNYSYGFLYGFVFALLAYNVMLFAGLRDTRYLLYSVYLGMFLLMNISYTGHGFKWLWPNDTTWAQWSNPILMVLFGSSGLLFALRFLDTRKHFPRIHKAVLGYIGASGLLLLLTILSNQQRNALLLSFTFVLPFTAIMLAMGIVALRSGQRPARYFLLAAIAAMVGAAVTALAVWGFIPFNSWTFRAVDIGMLLDATLLALALTYQFRVGQREKLRAEALATRDPLTGLNNRRAFYDKTAPIWPITLRHDHKLSVILLDIDRFKRINDAYGHTFGDEVLVATANALTNCIREQDVLARWGGEEFIILLPETDTREASALAERLRTAIAGIQVEHAGVDVRITASFGVAQRRASHQTLDAVISTADDHLYKAKDMGRNRVCCE